MNKYKTTILIIAVQYGSSALILPGITSLLGPVQFSMILFSIESFYFFCNLLAHDSYLHVLRKNSSCIEEFSRWPMKKFSYEAYGHCFSEFSIYLLVITLGLQTSSLFAVAAQMFQSFLPIDNISLRNQLILWDFILILLLLLPSLYRTYEELGMLTYICFAFICFYEICAISASILIYLNKDSFNVEMIKLATDTQSTYEMLISCIGQITFTTSGCALVLPNLAVTMTNREELRFPIVASSCIALVLYFVSGMVPYLLLQDYQLEPSLLSTLERIAAGHTITAYSTRALDILIILAQIAFTGHLALVCVLFVNPLFLFTEEKLKVPKDLGWKRVVTRCTIMLAICSVCMIFPNFAPLMSLVGGIPTMLQGLFIPMLIYLKLFPTRIWLKIFFAILFLVFFILMLNINFVNLYILIT